jgi:hypothetical protein
MMLPMQQRIQMFPCQHLSKLLVPQRLAAILVKDYLAPLNRMRITSVLVVRVAWIVTVIWVHCRLPTILMKDSLAPLNIMRITSVLGVRVAWIPHLIITIIWVHCRFQLLNQLCIVIRTKFKQITSSQGSTIIAITITTPFINTLATVIISSHISIHWQ